MNSLRRLASIVLMLAVAAGVMAGAWWLVNSKASETKVEKPAPAATINKVVKEEDLNTITLTEEAEKRLGLKVGAVETKAVRRVRVYGGEITIPVGRTILVAAPLGGSLRAPSGGGPKAGQTVKAGEAIFLLLPILTPESKATLSGQLADLDGRVDTAKTGAELTKKAHDRAKDLLGQGVGSPRLVEEAQAAFETAEKTLKAASASRKVFAKVIGDVEAGTAAPIAIDSPEDGILRAVSAMPGQTVPSGAALFEVVDLSAVWVRLPVPVGDLDELDRLQSVQIGKLSAAPGGRLAYAHPVAAPPSATLLSGTVDLFYSMPNPVGALTPGQRIGVTVPLNDAKESLTVPWSAVVFDVNGGNWIYEQLEPKKYARRRVTVRYTSGTDAVLASGPAAGTRIVTDGVQQLFGAETGFVK